MTVAWVKQAGSAGLKGYQQDFEAKFQFAGLLYLERGGGGGVTLTDLSGTNADKLYLQVCN